MERIEEHHSLCNCVLCWDEYKAAVEENAADTFAEERLEWLYHGDVRPSHIFSLDCPDEYLNEAEVAMQLWFIGIAHILGMCMACWTVDASVDTRENFPTGMCCFVP